MASIEIRADQCYQGTVVMNGDARQTVTRIFVSQADAKNPNDSMVTIVTDSGALEFKANARISVEY